MFSICLSQELFNQNISVCAIHPGQLLTRGRSSDADMEPAEAASHIYEYIKTLTIEGTGQFIQPQKGKLPW
ncbi:hypothetical protein XYCOK13_42230 [Xylanibacillus composti]|uniref:Uncharacterized protein n=1 Tax=Xylanibacillus composti TaxID=1572762 RepID=A0A8J4H5V7_9BACL|nr:hypothetical protein XYCOK13_42230 [Xylanibacillus composti]